MAVFTHILALVVGCAIGAGAMFMLILHDGQALDEEAR